TTPLAAGGGAKRWREAEQVPETAGEARLAPTAHGTTSSWIGSAAGSRRGRRLRSGRLAQGLAQRWLLANPAGVDLLDLLRRGGLTVHLEVTHHLVEGRAGGGVEAVPGADPAALPRGRAVELPGGRAQQGDPVPRRLDGQ